MEKRQNSDPAVSQGATVTRREELLLIRVMAYVGFVFVTGITFFLFFRAVPNSGVLDSVVKQHFLAITGVPMAAISAIILVAVFKATSGDVEFKAVGFEFRGASGPTILWVLSFLSCILGLRVLWTCS